MAEVPKIALFEGRKIRRQWDEKQEKWHFSLVDVIEILTDSKNPTDYLKKMRKRDKIFGSYIGTNCPQVEMVSETGKNRKVVSGRNFKKLPEQKNLRKK